MNFFFVYLIMSAAVFVINCAIFIYSFNMQATPFLHEEQRVDSAMIMLKTTLPAYAITAVLITVAFYFIAKKFNKNQ